MKVSSKCGYAKDVSVIMMTAYMLKIMIFVDTLIYLSKIQMQISKRCVWSSISTLFLRLTIVILWRTIVHRWLDFRIIVSRLVLVGNDDASRVSDSRQRSWRWTWAAEDSKECRREEDLCCLVQRAKRQRWNDDRGLEDPEGKDETPSPVPIRRKFGKLSEGEFTTIPFLEI